MEVKHRGVRRQHKDEATRWCGLDGLVKRHLGHGLGRHPVGGDIAIPQSDGELCRTRATARDLRGCGKGSFEIDVSNPTDIPTICDAVVESEHDLGARHIVGNGS